ncbi:ATP-binding cassette domain-containing protein [Megasphaera paucivorans]|uniref:Molybdate transport system ATP-binding protein n=1 Tax=Megasphaera paucivorans TaxID=349095 RepID=A0A1G9WFM3_9FIRM|nr:ATP-binding cassette domain-containing protein [Megasphaera paucivorans]SDM83107.1 molybdate transport system ATP-binding protein [Megasphaera paucivorans]
MSMTIEIHKQLGAFRLDVKFQLEHGVLGLLGASGSGKSKTLQCITGIERPDEGKIIINGRTVFDSRKNINLKTQERHVGYLFQNYALFPNMTVAENISCGVHTVSDKRERTNRIGDIIDRMQLSGLEKRKPAQLSGGQQQRVALARILINKPEILLLDEPFSALDSYLKEQLMTELHTLLVEFQKDVIVVTHSRDEAYQLCDHIAVLDAGHLDVFGETKKIFQDPATRVGAELTGCKNIVKANKIGTTQIYVPDWNLILDTGRYVGEGVQAIGIRAHCFCGEISENAFDITVVEQIEQPFEWIVKFQYLGQNKETKLIWWRFAKTDKPETMPGKLGIKGKNILLLYA